MSAPEPTPFAIVGRRDDGEPDWLNVIGSGADTFCIGIETSKGNRNWDWSCVMLNAAVQRERQAAAVKALWDAADALDAVLGEAAKFDPASHWLRGRAEAMQYIASRAERAEKGGA